MFGCPGKKNSQYAKVIGAGQISFALIVALLGACRSKIDIGQGTKRVNNRSAAVDVSPGFTGQRRYFQSRSMISFVLTEEQFAEGDTFSIVNVSNGATLIDDQEFSEEHFDAIIGGVALAIDGIRAVVRIYPQSPEMLGKLPYGTNLLRFKVSSSGKETAWEREIILEDFPVFALNRAAFSEDAQILRGFEGSFTGIVKPVVAAKNGNILRTGFLHIIND
jgi:hypothetical protein